MRWRLPKELIIGVGIGLILAASFSMLFDNISDRDIERRARDLGMIYRDETLAGGMNVVLLLQQPAAVDAVAGILQEGGVIADKQTLINAAAARKVTTIAAGTYRFSGPLDADATLTKLTGGGSK